jgi:type I restriction enzyme M protein
MLDSDTKRRIDTARDILVGKLPDPKSQVEQITIALIYKFMDDMDAQAVEYGGEPSFFVGDFESYGWRKLFSPNVGGHELLALYGEAITKLNQNPQLPQLFRDIFKNAFLPYRDPETLKLFLKTINEFQYDNSERLGDAFEYLLSVLGSQGDAGQFRTPRHIIDFIVEVVQPKKNETVCDPACGTAGFLISSYKHILKDNMRRALGDLLTPDERKKLMTNFVGYDISPDMVRLSLVNMYLHGFPDPHIYEYDTLTSEERWNDSFDVVMANPPFMSPKGGIKPHKKFSLQANRSEVLFVDYIAEHINPVSGRAGVIVPEGIIFQSANAYKDLRKMLVEKSFLYAVVSLPAGVFNPYSGVKTSILFFDKTLAAKSDKILFIKIADDGFGLGAQRKQLKTSDLPDALNVILDFQKAIAHGDTSSFADGELSLQAFAIEKSRIAENADFYLLGERYRTNKTRQHKFEMVELGEVCEVINGRAYKQEELLETGKYPVLRVGNFFSNRNWYYSNLELPQDKYCEKGDLLYAWSASFGPRIWDGAKAIYHYHIWKMIPDENRINKLFLYQILERDTDEIKAEGGRGIAMMHITKAGIEKRRVPLPPLSVQKEIIERIKSYQRLIDGAKQVIQSFKPNIQTNPDWQMVELSEVCDVRDGTHDSPQYVSEGFPLVTSKNLKDGRIDFSNVSLISREDLDKINARSFVEDGDIIMPMIGTIGNPVIVKKEREFGIKNVALIKFHSDSKINRYFLLNILSSEYFNSHFASQSLGATQKFISLGFIRKLQIPLPPLEEQKQIVAQIKREQSLVNANKELIKIYEQKIKDEINKLWEE